MLRASVIALSLAACSRSDHAVQVHQTTPSSPEPAVDAHRDPARAVLLAADPGIAAFWPWWASLDAATRSKIATGQAPALAEELNARVTAMHPQLTWEFGPGQTSEHALTLSGEGDPVVRLVAERWRRAGPAGDATWSYQTQRQAIPREELLGMRLGYEGVDLPFGETRVVAVRDDRRPKLDVSLWHPALARLPEDSRRSAAFIMLDQTLGEDATERWTGKLDVVATEPAGAIDLLGLVDAIAEVARSTGANTHALLEGKDPASGQRLIFDLDVTLGRWDHPFHDTWCDVAMHYTANAAGFPSEDELAELHRREDELVTLLGERARHVGSATGAGKRRAWLYLDGDSEAAAIVSAWVRKQSRRIEVETKFDPGWAELPL